MKHISLKALPEGYTVLKDKPVMEKDKEGKMKEKVVMETDQEGKQTAKVIMEKVPHLTQKGFQFFLVMVHLTMMGLGMEWTRRHFPGFRFANMHDIYIDETTVKLQGTTLLWSSHEPDYYIPGFQTFLLGLIRVLKAKVAEFLEPLKHELENQRREMEGRRDTDKISIKLSKVNLIIKKTLDMETQVQSFLFNLNKINTDAKAICDTYKEEQEKKKQDPDAKTTISLEEYIYSKGSSLANSLLKHIKDNLKLLSGKTKEMNRAWKNYEFAGLKNAPLKDPVKFKGYIECVVNIVFADDSFPEVTDQTEIKKIGKLLDIHKASIPKVGKKRGRNETDFEEGEDSEDGEESESEERTDTDGSRPSSKDTTPQKGDGGFPGR